MSKIIRFVCYSLFLFVAGFLISWFVSNGRINSLENGLADIEAINLELQAESKRATEYTNRIQRELDNLTGRISTAQSITGEISSELEGSGNTIDRAIQRVDRIEKALQIIFDGM